MDYNPFDPDVPVQDPGAEPAAAANAESPAIPPHRRMPRNEEAERQLLGAILVNNRWYEQVAGFLEPDHFYDPAHGRIFAAVGKMLGRGQNATPTTLQHYFESDDELQEIGGARYLGELAASVVAVVDAADQAKEIYDLYLRRRLIDLGEDIVTANYKPDLDSTAFDQIEQAEKQLYDLASAGQLEGGFKPFKDALAESIETANAAFARDSHVTGVTTGLLDLDRKLGGLHYSDLIILAGRPAMGKTALATNIAYNAARSYLDSGGRDGGVVGFFSLEMSSEQLATRILAEITRISSDKIRRGELRSDDFPKFVEASQTLADLPLYIDDTPDMSVQAMRTRCRRLQRQRGLDMIVVDYVQLMRPSGMRQQDNRVQEVSQITRGLKAIAKEFNVPVLALSQLSRAVEQREDKRPQLADLRESGSIEQDADVVGFVFREEYYVARSEPAQKADETHEKFNDRYQRWQQRLADVANTAEVILAKQRHGPIGTVKLFFEGEFTRFDNLDAYHSD